MLNYFVNVTFIIKYFINRNLEKAENVLLTHGDCIERVADTFRVIATSGNFIVGIANDKLRLYGLQFHPEVNIRDLIVFCVFDIYSVFNLI